MVHFRVDVHGLMAMARATSRRYGGSSTSGNRCNRPWADAAEQARNRTPPEMKRCKTNLLPGLPRPTALAGKNARGAAEEKSREVFRRHVSKRMRFARREEPPAGAGSLGDPQRSPGRRVHLPSSALGPKRPPAWPFATRLPHSTRSRRGTIDWTSKNNKTACSGWEMMSVRPHSV